MERVEGALFPSGQWSAVKQTKRERGQDINPFTCILSAVSAVRWRDDNADLELETGPLSGVDPKKMMNHDRHGVFGAWKPPGQRWFMEGVAEHPKIRLRELVARCCPWALSVSGGTTVLRSCSEFKLIAG